MSDYLVGNRLDCPQKRQIISHLSPNERKDVRRWTLNALAGYSALALMLLGSTAIYERVLADDAAVDAHVGVPNYSSFGRVASTPSCAAWDDAAAAAVTKLAATNIALVRVEDAKFRLRRARRNCAAGWLDLACGDYQALAKLPLPPGDGKRHALKISHPCTMEVAERKH